MAWGQQEDSTPRLPPSHTCTLLTAPHSHPQHTWGGDKNSQALSVLSAFHMLSQSAQQTYQAGTHIISIYR